MRVTRILPGFMDFLVADAAGFWTGVVALRGGRNGHRRGGRLPAAQCGSGSKEDEEGKAEGQFASTRDPIDQVHHMRSLISPRRPWVASNLRLQATMGRSTHPVDVSSTYLDAKGHFGSRAVLRITRH